MGDDPNNDGTGTGTYMGEDPSDSSGTPGTYMGEVLDGGGKSGGGWNPGDAYQKEKDGYGDVYAEALSNVGNDGSAAALRFGELQSRYRNLKADYDDARREADSYIERDREEETGRLRRGITVGGFPGSRRNDLTSGATAYSDRSRKRGRITAGPRRREDRPFATRGMRAGADLGSSYFDSR